MTHYSTLTVAEYIKVADLSEQVNTAVNACAAIRPHPSLVPAFLAQHFHAQHFESPAAVAIESVKLFISGVDGTGTPQLSATMSLVDGRSSTSVVSHSCGAASTHPSSSRINRRVADVRQRSARAKAIQEVAASPDLGNLLTNAITEKQLNASKSIRDFDACLSLCDGSSNYSVLGSNIAAAVSFCFAKLRCQIQRTPLGLHQPLFRQLSNDLLPLLPQTQATMNNNNNNNQNSTGSMMMTGGSNFSFSCPIPLVPLFGSDPPVFGKFRLLKHVVIFPTVAQINTSISEAINNLQAVVNVCYEKLTSDENTQQPPILLPHAQSIIKHVNLDHLPALLDFVEECIKEAKLVPGQDILVGLVLDAALCSPRGNPADDASSSSSSSSPGSKKGEKHGRGGATSNTNKTPARSSAASAAASAAAGGGGGEGEIHSALHHSGSGGTGSEAVASGLMPVPAVAPKYTVIEGGGPEWTGAQLADHLASAVVAKPWLQYLQDSLREDDVVELRRLMARIGHKCSIAGDEIFCSNQNVVEKQVSECIANTLVTRVSDAGTLSNAVSAARSFQAVMPGGNLCVAADCYDGEAAAVVDFAFAARARFLHCSGLSGGANCQGAVMLSRLLNVANELQASSELKTTPALDYSRINLPAEPAEPLGPLEVPNPKDAKRKR